jgi:dGTPase
MLYSLQKLQEKEEKLLAPYAVKSSETQGRKHKKNYDDGRLCFQRDKDRIIHCKAFRRLDEKTQVFIAGSGDHYRTRLTHTLEMTQISRDIARRLGLNEDLCETIALAHDLGHPPFGHGGEEALNEMMRKYGLGFEHNEQSRRIVEKLEKAYPHFEGLNLSVEILDGLIKHQSTWDQKNMEFKSFPHLEAQVVNVADEIAYTNHDIDDGLRSGCITLKELEDIELWQMGKKTVEKKYGKNLEKGVYISRTISAIISLMIGDFCEQTEKNIQTAKIKTLEDVRKHEGVLACFSNDMKNLIRSLNLFLYDNFYMDPKILGFINKGKKMLKELFEFYMENPDEFPKDGLADDKKDFAVAVKDYIAGMTDGFLVSEFKKLVEK